MGEDSVRTQPTETEVSTDPSWQLVYDVQNGNMSKFGAIYQHYAGSLLAYFLARGLDRATAEDLTSETFIRALRAIGTVSYQGKEIGAWLRTIARNLTVDHVKSGRYRHETLTADLLYLGHSTTSPESQVLASFELNDLSHHLRQLSDDQRKCLILRRVLGLSVSETAVALEKSTEAVKALLYRACRYLNAAVAASDGHDTEEQRSPS
jgi:RNA polymerase sigma-70 factor (ECF subfamily)